MPARFIEANDCEMVPTISAVSVSSVVAICACCASRSGLETTEPMPKIAEIAPRNMHHIAICAIPTNPTPIILPSSSSMGLQQLTITSIMRLVFSSTTLVRIIAPYIITNIYVRNARISPMTLASSASDRDSSPSSLHFTQFGLTSTWLSAIILSSCGIWYDAIRDCVMVSPRHCATCLCSPIRTAFSENMSTVSELSTSAGIITMA